ncbi:MAG: hypothetical protein EOP01_02745 [Propionibacteriaceae bacterium]|nr:MAG: hypothetical protein EOP01_02745 [Propionibacteriaceae bacterium]
MDVFRALAADLRDLAVDLSVGGYTRTTMAMLEYNLRRKVPSILGASIALQTSEVLVVVHFVSRVLEPDEIGAVLVLPLAGLPVPRTGSITFYAGEPGGFTVLIPDLAQALHLDPSDIDPHPSLPTTPISPRVDGLQDFAVVNRALGFLLNRGHTLDTARTELVNHAQHHQTDLTAAAHDILGGTHR